MCFLLNRLTTRCRVTQFVKCTKFDLFFNAFINSRKYIAEDCTSTQNVQANGLGLFQEVLNFALSLVKDQTMTPNKLRFACFVCLMFQTGFGFMVLVVRPCLIFEPCFFHGGLDFGSNKIRNRLKLAFFVKSSLILAHCFMP